MHGLPFVHRASILDVAAPRPGCTEQRRRFWRIDDVYDKTRRIQPVRIYRQGIVCVHAKRCGVDDDLELLRISWASRCSATGDRSHRLREGVSTTLVNVEYGEHSSARRRDCECNGPARAPGADQ
jgi:hypothetical protein